MEDKDLLNEGRVPGEIVEYYHAPAAREVVEVYVQPRPLPGLDSAAPAQIKGKRSKKGLLIFLICCGTVAVLAAASYGINLWLRAADEQTHWDDFEYRYETPRESGDFGAVRIPTYPTGQGVTLPLALNHGDTLPIQEIYRGVNPAVVTVMAQRDDGISIGTGVIFTADGYVLTNYHVVEESSDCTVALDTGRTFAALYVAGDRDNDLAVLKVEQEGLPAAEFGDSETLSVGDTVYAIGNPLGVELRGTLTDGIVSAINRNVRVDGRTMTLIQTNAALNFGNSGGPLINQYGQVVGINTIKMSSSYSNIEGLGFAIPSAAIEYMVNDLLTYGILQPEPMLGLSVGQVGIELPDGRWGVEVFDVTPGSPADLAGVEMGDILVAAGGESVAASRELLRIRNRYQVGEELSVTVWRNGAYRDLTLNLTEAMQ